MQNSKLRMKTCPFCGAEAQLCSSYPDKEGRISFRVICSDWECQGSYCNSWLATPEDAVASWNRRAGYSKYKRDCLRYCTKAKTMKCPTSKSCYSKPTKPYFRLNHDKLGLIDKIRFRRLERLLKKIN